MSDYDVKVYAISERAERGHRRSTGPSKLYRVRWMVSGHRFERSFTTKALADSWRSNLMHAANNGAPFDGASGLPVSMVREHNSTTWYDHARAYIAMKWPGLAPKSRRSTAEALVTLTATLVISQVGKPDDAVLRGALLGWAFNPLTWSKRPPVEVAVSLAWMTRTSIPINRLRELELVRAALGACATRLDGKVAAAATSRRKRAVFYNALGYAVERELLDYNPIDRVQWRAPTVGEEVDRRVVASTAQVEKLLAVLPTVHPRGQHLVAFFGCLYYAAMRPAEAAQLRETDCELPACGWGRILLAESAPHAGSAWTDDGSTRQARGLKHRGSGAIRPIPIPPELVGLLRQHIEREGTADDGRIFRARQGGYLYESSYGIAWKAARRAALTPAQAASPLAGRPYDLRHAGVTLWLNGGVPAPEVARRAGHGVGVLLRVYAGCIDGEEEIVNLRISRAMRASRDDRRARR